MSISVAMAVFDGARYLSEQLRSIVDGDVVPQEIVVSDDGSRDETLEIVRRFSRRSRDPDIRIVGNDGARGVVHNISTAMKNSSGDIVVLADQDDVWHSDRLVGIAERFAVDTSLSLVHSNADLVGAGGEPLGFTLFEALGVGEADVQAERENAFVTLLRKNTVTGATSAVRRELVDLALPVPPTWMHDEWLGIVGAATGRIEIDTRARIDYRQHGGNQIGARVPTLRYRLRRMAMRDSERNRRLAARSDELVSALERLPVTPVTRAEAAAKARFERARASMPRVRLLRVAEIARLARGREYTRFASQGRRDILRDLIQPR